LLASQNVTVSIIMPHFNRSETVKKSINSVIQQAYQAWELIIVDDFSKDIDKLEAYLLELNDPRVKLIKHSENLNGAQARNTGLEQAKGEYIAFLDSDDLWAKEKLSLQLSSQLAPNEIRYSQLCCYNSLTPEQKVVLPIRGKNEDEGLSTYLFSNHGIVQTSSLLLHKKFAKEIMFNPELRRHQDYDFLLRAEHQGATFTYLDKPLVDYVWIGTEGIQQKSISVERSLTWLNEYKKYFSNDDDITGFIDKEVIATALRTKQLSKLFNYGKERLSSRDRKQLYIKVAKRFFKLAINKIKRVVTK